MKETQPATVGFASISALDRPLLEAAEIAARCGVHGLEVTDRPPHGDEIGAPDDARRLGDAIRSLGLEVLTYGSYLACTDGDALARVGAEVERASALGASRLRVWATHSAGADGSAEGDVVSLLQATADAAAEAGIEVVVERHDGSFADTIARTHALLDAVDRPNLSLNYQVRDLLHPSDLPAIEGDVRALVPRARYFHLKNFRPNPDASGPLLPGGALGSGVLDYRSILAAAVEVGYRGPFTIEFLSWEPIPLEQKLAADVATLNEILSELDLR